MRRATHDVSWLIDDNDQTIGISLGYDFCAEHEFGVKRLRQDLGISGGHGVEGRTMTKQPRAVSFHTYERTRKKKRGTRKAPPKDPAALFIVGGYPSGHREGEMSERLKYICRDGIDFYAEEHDDWYRADRDTLAAAWDENGFAIHTRGEENIRRLTELAERLKENDIALADPSGMGFVGRRGLGVIIASRVSQEARDNTLAADLAHEKLVNAVKTSGIEQELKDAGKRFYALSPAWANEDETELKFFLNPAEQQKYNHGWYNLDELRQWAKDEGPVVKDQPAATRKMKP